MSDNKTFKPTEEQLCAIDLFRTGDSLKINAYAGTGKTATLNFLARTTSRPGTYLAFNRALADEAKTKFPQTVACSTTHQLAYHDTPDVFRRNRNKMFGAINANFVSRKFRLEKLIIDNQFMITSRQRGAMILETVRRFAYSSDKSMTRNHVPLWGKMNDLPVADKEGLMDDAMRYARHLWGAMIDPSDDVPLGHDGYYKLWALSEPVISGDYILVDESQDTNGAMLGVLKKQNAQMIYVGDRYQQIYEWRGAVNAMTNIITAHNSTLTQSFRFGSAIAAVASQILGKLGEKDQIIGNPRVNSILRCTRPSAILCRTNAGVIEQHLKALEADLKPHVIGGNDEILRLLKGVAQLKMHLPVDLPEFFGFKDWQDVVEFSQTEEGVHLAMIVRLVESYGEDHLIEVLSEMHQSERSADLVLSTVHRAKGRQWSNVLINGDFSLVEKKDNQEIFKAEELRLFYVAVTRAQEELQLPPRQEKAFCIQLPEF